MEYRRLGNAEWELSTITYGAFAIGGTMWGGTEKKDSIDSIHASIDNGVTTIDTAPFYGFGLSEEMIGGIPFRFEWGSKIFTLPFSVKLNAFLLERYAGSMSPMSYSSEVEVVEKEKKKQIRLKLDSLLLIKREEWFLYMSQILKRKCLL